MKSEDKKKLEKFRDQVSIPLKNTDPDKWPIRAGRIGHIILDKFSSELVNDIHELKRRKMTTWQIGQLFHNPSRLWRMSHHFLRGLQSAGYSLDEQREHILTYLEMIRSLKYDSEFVNNGKNLILSPEQVKTIGGQELKRSDSNTSRILHNFIGLIWAYAETLYFVAHELSLEIHGPYQYDSNKIMIVRDYFNLKPIELWPECETIPCDNIKAVCIYKDLEIEFDVYNNPYLKQGRFVDNLELYHIEIDGQPVNISAITGLADPISAVIKAVSSKVSEWPLLKVGKKYANIFWYRKKPLCEALRKDWKPSREVMNRFDTMVIAPDVVKPADEAEIKRKLDLVGE